MSTRGSAARALFEEGYNCAQAVAAAFAPEMGVSQETAARLLSPFGGGMGRMREVCGAFSGLLAVFGMLYGYSDPAATDEKKALYADVQQMAAEFRAQNGSLICRDLLGLREGASDPTPAPRTPEYYHSRRCGDMVESAANILQAYMETHPRG